MYGRRKRSRTQDNMNSEADTRQSNVKKAAVMKTRRKLSMCLMAGNKKKLFVLVLSFIGWFVLSALTLGSLYVVYVGPYRN